MDKGSGNRNPVVWILWLVEELNGSYQSFYLPTDAQESCLKRILKFTLKQLLHVSFQSPSSRSVLFELAKVTVIT